MLSTLIGLLLVALGIVCYGVALIVYYKTQVTDRIVPHRNFSNPDLKTIAEVLENLAKVLEQFGKLSVPVQWALLGSLNIGIGLYLLASKPF